jgi:hypothetical protein
MKARPRGRLCTMKNGDEAERMKPVSPLTVRDADSLSALGISPRA